MTDLVGLIVSSVFALAMALLVARRDLLTGVFVAFFFLYTIAAMVSYVYVPILPWALGVYFGRDLYDRYYWFIFESFATLGLMFVLLRRWLFRPARYDVTFAPTAFKKLLVLMGTLPMLAVLAGLYYVERDTISYASEPQIPNFFLAVAFKLMVGPLLVFYVFARRHAENGLERAVIGATLLIGGAIFLSIATRAGNRTDILALILGIVMFELYPSITDSTGALRFAQLLRLLRTTRTLVLALLLGGGLVVMTRLQATRTAPIPGMSSTEQLLYNDYLTPAYVLFAAMGQDFVDPALVARSNVANGLYLGRVLDVPYLQGPVTDPVAPTQSTRSSSYAFYLFTEGYLVLGSFGFLYNALVPLLGIALWRLLSSSQDSTFNSFGAALTAMSFATLTRTQSMLFVRSFLSFALPTMVLYMMLTGARLTSSRVARVP